MSGGRASCAGATSRHGRLGLPRGPGWPTFVPTCRAAGSDQRGRAAGCSARGNPRQRTGTPRTSSGGCSACAALRASTACRAEPRSARDSDHAGRSAVSSVVVSRGGQPHADRSRELSSIADLARSMASAWRSDSRPRVSSARAATCDTPSASASSSPDRSCSSDRSSAWRWRGGMRSECALEVAGKSEAQDLVLGARGAAARLAGPRHEAHDLAPAQLVERGATCDLVQPGARSVVVLERVEGAVRLDEGSCVKSAASSSSRTIRQR